MTRRMLTVARYSFQELLRGWWAAAYTLFFMVATWALFYFGEEPAQAVVSLLSLVLIVIPLVSAVVGVIHFYNCREFAELLLAQPIDRRTVFLGQYLGLSLCLALAFVAGLGVPLLWYGLRSDAPAMTLLVLLAAGVLLTLIFVEIAFLVSVRTENRVRALGGVIFVWLYLALLYDGILLTAIVVFRAYPLEKVLLALTFFNPLDLARIMILMRLDVSALMGYTGAVFQRFFGSSGGLGAALAALALWTLLPALLGARAYVRRDF